MLKESDIDLVFIDKGYGITYVGQTIVCDEFEFSIEVNNCESDQIKWATKFVREKLSWIQANEEMIKSDISKGLHQEFDLMRKNKDKNVPEETRLEIYNQLQTIYPHEFIAYLAQNTYQLRYWMTFNGFRYIVYISFNMDNTLKYVGILTMGGFKKAKQAEALKLNTAKDLYSYHLDHEGELGLERFYQNLPESEIEKIIDIFIADDGNEDGRLDILLYLCMFSGEYDKPLPDRLFDYLIREEIFYYSQFYFRANHKYASILIKLLENTNKSSQALLINNILCSLVCIPSEKVAQFLYKNSIEPLPIWATNLQILPKEYSKLAGWEVINEGEIRMLYDDKVLCLEKSQKPTNKVPLVTSKETCGLCKNKLITMFNFEGNEYATCLHCACYQTIFTDEQGRWYLNNEVGEFYSKYPEYIKSKGSFGFKNYLKTKKSVRSSFAVNNQFVNVSRSQIGGIPTEINKVSYPMCPVCHKTMKYVAQLDMEDLGSEGIYYFFKCSTCDLIGSNYDQS
ncbi:MAG: hypothetical protein RR565_05115 [Erysipelothrix sp.]